MSVSVSFSVTVSCKTQTKPDREGGTEEGLAAMAKVAKQKASRVGEGKNEGGEEAGELGESQAQLCVCVCVCDADMKIK